MITLLALASCEPDAVPKETGDTAADSAPDSVQDSGDSTDTGADTAGETGDSAPQVECDRTQPWSYVAAGMGQTCGVHIDGCAECWGANYPIEGGGEWQVEDKPPAWSYLSIHMLRYTEYTYGQHNCGILDDGGAVCFGNNKYGELDVPEGDYLDIAVADDHTFFITSDGRLDWVGIGSASERPEGDFTRVVTNGDYAVALSSDGSLTEFFFISNVVYTLPGPYVSMSLSAYYQFVCAVTGTGAVECWEEDTFHDETFEAFAALAPSEGIAEVCVPNGWPGACALGVDGHVECWTTYAGALFVDDAPTTTNFVQLACGDAHACALTSVGEIACWGEDRFGETTPPS